ncbi:MAG: hypothetical protein F7C07_06270 [Desulfurococcales archaeon]|nr:hypothetical protein [Desulfurococcales archaeon]
MTHAVRERLAWVLSLVLLLSLTVIAPPVSASSDEYSVQEVLENFEYHVDAVREMLLGSLRSYIDGDSEEAFTLARDAYLEHFEPLEIPLRAVNPDFVVEMELRFAELRNMIRAGEDPGAVRDKVYEILGDMDRVELALDAMANPSSIEKAASIVTFISSSIVVREGVEVVIFLSVLYAVILATRSYAMIKFMRLGVILSVPAVLATWFVIDRIVELSGVGRAFAEVVLTAIALAIIGFVGLEALRAFRGPEWMEFVRAKMWDSVTSGKALGMLALSFTLIYREGFELVLFYQVLKRTAVGFDSYILSGLIIGLVVIALVALAIVVAGLKLLPMRAFIGFSVAVTAYISFMLMGNIVEELQELGYVRETPIYWLADKVSPTLSDVTGIHPTIETMAAQALVLIAYAAALLYVFKARKVSISKIASTE